MSTHTTIDPPTLDGFETHYGVPVCALGEEGETWVALGVHEPRRVLAAFNRLCRTSCGYPMAQEWSIKAKDLRRERWVVATECGDCGSDPDCRTCRAIADAKWWLRMATDRDAESFPVTVWIN